MSRITKFALMLAVGVVLVGCSSDKEKAAWEDPFFPPDRVAPPSKAMSDRQAANGAAADGMLFDVHFDGSALNSLGKQKLELMVKGTSPSTPVRVFLNMPKDAETTSARQANVESALDAAGVAKGDYAIAIGPNPGVLNSAEAGIRALSPVEASEETVKANSAKAE